MECRIGSFFLVLVGVLFGLGCAPSGLAAQDARLPTLMPLVLTPVPTEIAVVTAVPATFTPAGTPPETPLPPATITPPPVSPTSAPTSTTTVMPTATATATATAATPLPTPPIVTVSARAPFIENLPETVACGENGRLFRSEFPSEVGGAMRAYHVYLPSCYGLDGRVYPVLYLFHSSIQDDSHWADLGVANIVNDGIRNGQYPPFIIIMPDNGLQGNSTSGGVKSVEGIVLNDLLPFVASTLCSWEVPEGRSLGGISRGGYWALMLAMRHPDLFSSVSGHSSHLRFETDDERYNPLATYKTADLSNLRIWMDWGETDFLRLGQRQLSNVLLDEGADITVTVNEGGHDELYWLTHLQEYIDWHAAAWPTERTDYPACDL